MFLKQSSGKKWTQENFWYTLQTQENSFFFAKKVFVNNRESLIDFRECNPWNLIKLNSMKVNNGNGK